MWKRALQSENTEQLPVRLHQPATRGRQRAAALVSVNEPFSNKEVEGELGDFTSSKDLPAEGRTNFLTGRLTMGCNRGAGAAADGQSVLVTLFIGGNKI